jgi:2Fe-2S ferredoxin
VTKVIFVEHNGVRHEVEAGDGDSAMRVANDHGVPGLVADCGGAMTCATCHVYVAQEWLDRVGPALNDEKEMLEAAVDPQPNSRLSCQIFIHGALDGIVLNIPKTQF